jgi:hypothetical protein
MRCCRQQSDITVCLYHRLEAICLGCRLILSHSLRCIEQLVRRARRPHPQRRASPCMQRTLAPSRRPRSPATFHQRPFHSYAMAAANSGIGTGLLVRDDVNALEILGEARGQHFAFQVMEIAFGDKQQAVVAVHSFSVSSRRLQIELTIAYASHQISQT